MNYNIKVYQLIYPDQDQVHKRKCINSKINKQLIASYTSTKDSLSSDYIKIYNRYKHVKNVHVEL